MPFTSSPDPVVPVSAALRSKSKPPSLAKVRFAPSVDPVTAPARLTVAVPVPAATCASMPVVKSLIVPATVFVIEIDPLVAAFCALMPAELAAFVPVIAAPTDTSISPVPLETAAAIPFPAVIVSSVAIVTLPPAALASIPILLPAVCTVPPAVVLTLMSPLVERASTTVFAALVAAEMSITVAAFRLDVTIALPAELSTAPFTSRLISVVDAAFALVAVTASPTTLIVPEVLFWNSIPPVPLVMFRPAPAPVTVSAISTSIRPEPSFVAINTDPVPAASVPPALVVTVRSPVEAADCPMEIRSPVPLAETAASAITLTFWDEVAVFEISTTDWEPPPETAPSMSMRINPDGVLPPPPDATLIAEPSAPVTVEVLLIVTLLRPLPWFKTSTPRGPETAAFVVMETAPMPPCVTVIAELFRSALLAVTVSFVVSATSPVPTETIEIASSAVDSTVPFKVAVTAPPTEVCVIETPTPPAVMSPFASVVSDNAPCWLLSATPPVLPPVTAALMFAVIAPSVVLAVVSSIAVPVAPEEIAPSAVNVRFVAVELLLTVIPRVPVEVMSPSRSATVAPVPSLSRATPIVVAVISPPAPVIRLVDVPLPISSIPPVAPEIAAFAV